jgi:hypothetical protein
MASAIELTASRDALNGVIRRVRNRWRAKLALRGLAIIAAAALVAIAVASYGIDRARFEPAVVLAWRVGIYVLVAALAVRYLILPLMRRVSDDRVALYLEEHEPSLDTALLSAVEHAGRDIPVAMRSPGLLRKLLETALAKVRAVDDGVRVDAGGLRMVAFTLAGIVTLGFVMFGAGPTWLRHAGRLVVLPWHSATEDMPYGIVVLPGNVTVAKGGDELIRAELRGFDADVTDLVVRRGANGEWVRLPMTALRDTARFEARLFDITERSQYFVESKGVRSAVFRIDVTNLPYVQQIDLEYHYPAYTGLPVEKVEKGGDITAPRGTSVTVHATTTMPVKGGRILIEGAPPVVLALGADGSLSGAITVTKNGFYKLELQAPDGRTVPGSLDYTIDVLDDRPPTVRFAKPGRDTRVTAVEEVFTQVEASDDYGVAKLELTYSVNGGPPQTVALQSAGTAKSKDVSAGHTFFLEEMHLSPGDLVSYHATATDNDRVGGGQTASTDIYFMQVRPFGQDYKQQQSQQPGGGGGGQDDPGALSQRQRDIVAGTFKVERDRSKIAPTELRDNFTTLHLAQGRLREDVDLLAQRMVQRGVASMDSTFKIIMDELPKAAAEMKDAEQELFKRASKDALPPEERALQHLQRAEAAFRLVNITINRGGGGGGGGKQSRVEDLADLFELETDKLRNQYETVNRGQQQEADNKVDETAEKLKELASRQQQEAERMRRLGGTPNASSGGGDSQRQLASEAEQLARQLERLTHDQPQASNELRETARRLQEAADAMRRSASGGKDGGAGQAASALERLQEARRLLDENRNGRGQRDAEDAERRAEAIAKEQREIASDVEKFGQNQAGANQGERLQQLQERKKALAGKISDLESQLDRLGRESMREKPEAARKMQDAAGSIRSTQLPRKVLYSADVLRRGSPEYSRAFEQQLTSDADSLRQKVADAAGAMRDGASKSANGSKSLAQARDLVRGAQSLQDRTRQRRLGEDTKDGQSGAQQGRNGGQQNGQQQASGGQQQGNQRGQQNQQGGQQNGQQNGQQAGQQGAGQQGQQGQQGGGQQGQAGQQGQQGGQQGQQGQGGQRGQGQQGGGQPNANGQQGGQQPNARGGGAINSPGGGGVFGPITPGPGNPGGRLSPEDIRQFSREYRDRRQAAEALRKDLQNQNVDVGELDRTIQRMRALESQKSYEDPAQLERLQDQVLEGLKAFEFALRRQSEEGDRGRPVLGGSADVPAEFRQLVAEYYKSLSKKAPK